MTDRERKVRRTRWMANGIIIAVIYVMLSSLISNTLQILKMLGWFPSP